MRSVRHARDHRGVLLAQVVDALQLARLLLEALDLALELPLDLLDRGGNEAQHLEPVLVAGAHGVEALVDGVGVDLAGERQHLRVGRVGR